MEFIKLNNGVEIPKLGFGVYQIPKEDTERCVLDAIEVGYRLIDTAQGYFNEKEVGNAISKTTVAREELFITTKVFCANYGYEKTLASLEESMKKLQVDYIDLVLVHHPFGDCYGAYRALEKLYEQGKLKAIGVSNFLPDRLTDIALFNKVIPQINQVEVNVFQQQLEAHENMIKLGVQMQAWAPFGQGRNDMFNNPILSEIASKYDKTVAQVILRWLTQKDIVALAKTVNKDRMKQNFDIFDFELSKDDMETILNMNTNESLFNNYRDPKAVENFAKAAKNYNNNK